MSSINYTISAVNYIPERYSMEPMTAKNFIKEIRKDRKLTQEQLAELCDTTQETIQRLESGKRRLTIDWLMILTKALNCEVSEITEGLLPSISYSQTESDLLEKFRGLSERDKKMFSSMLDTLSKEINSLEDITTQEPFDHQSLSSREKNKSKQ